MSTSAAPLYGLVLAGGSSSRMQRDKATLQYAGVSQLDRAVALLAAHVERVFVSVRASQIDNPARTGRPLIVDSVAGEGPMVGIRSALAAHPDAAWLVLACDLPYLTHATLEHLIAQRDPRVFVTAYRSAHDGLPEPLCAIWEPAAAAGIDTALRANARACPRKFIIRNLARLLDLSEPRALDNVNTPQEYADARETLANGMSAMHLKIQYFALLREQAGRSEETLETGAATPADLFEELRERHGFTLPRTQLKVAVNSEFAEWSRRLVSGDSVVFLPPVAGG